MAPALVPGGFGLSESRPTRLRSYGMLVWCRLILLMAALLGGVATLRAESAEERAFGAAVAAFRTGFWDRSEKAFADLQRRFPASTHLPEALLLQAEARFQLGEFSAAVALLSANQALAARWADEYLQCHSCGRRSRRARARRAGAAE